MRNKEFKQMFKKEFQEKYPNKLHTSDIFEEGQLKKKTFTYKNYCFWKYSSITSICLLLICFVFIGLLSNEAYSNNQKFDNVYLEEIMFDQGVDIITEEEYDDLKTICDGGIHSRRAKYFTIDDSLTLYVYKGVKNVVVNDKVIFENVYIYLFDFKDNNRNVILNVNNQEIVVNADSRYGILTSINENERQEIEFSLSYNSNCYNVVYDGEK